MFGYSEVFTRFELRFYHIRSVGVYSGTPITTVPNAEAYYISFRINSATAPEYAWDLVETMGIDTPFEIVQAFCKAFCWTYEFKSSPFALTHSNRLSTRLRFPHTG